MYNWLNGFYRVMNGKYSITLLFFRSNAPIIVKPHPTQYEEGGDIVGIYLTSNQSPYPGAEMGDQIPQLSPYAEVRKIGDLTLYIAYENTWNLVQVKCPTLGMKFCIKSLGNASPIPVGWGLILIGA